MAPKRPSPLDDPPAVSSSEEEIESSEEEDGEEEEESGSGSESEEAEPPKTSSSAPTPVAEKKPPPKKLDSATVNSKPQSSSSGSESESESDSDVGKEVVVKPIASKPMEETPKTKKPRSKPSATTTPAAKAGSKRSSESELKDSKRPKKKGAAAEPDEEPDQVEEESKKSGGDEKKLFQRIWSDEDGITILKGMIDYTAKKGADPHSDMAAFYEFIKKSLKADVNKTQLQDKVRRLKKKYEASVAKGKKYNPVKPYEIKVFDLSKKVWGAGEGSSAVTVVVEPAKSNGKAKANQKNNKSVTLASMKAEILASPERQKEAEKVEFGVKACASSEGLNEVIGFDKGFREMGLPEAVVKQGLELLGGSKRDELKEKWKKLHVAELELFVKRTELMTDQAKQILEAFKSSED